MSLRGAFGRRSNLIVSSAITDFRRAWLIMRSSDLLHKFAGARFFTESGSCCFSRFWHEIMQSAIIKAGLSLVVTHLKGFNNRYYASSHIPASNCRGVHFDSFPRLELSRSLWLPESYSQSADHRNPGL